MFATELTAKLDIKFTAILLEMLVDTAVVINKTDKT